jgi:hypothetical protein
MVHRHAVSTTKPYPGYQIIGMHAVVSVSHHPHAAHTTMQHLWTRQCVDAGCSAQTPQTASTLGPIDKQRCIGNSKI